jgi:membrane protease subunit (stomatin/prohibitin family)
MEEQQHDIQAAMKAQAALASAPWHACEKGNSLYETGMMFKRVSPILSPTGKEEFATAEVVICKQCGKIPPFFASKIADCPPELVSECKK